MSPEVLDLIKVMIVGLTGTGVGGGIVAIIQNRHQPPIDRKAADDASRRSWSETFGSDLKNLRDIIDEVKERREEDRADFESRLERQRLDHERQLAIVSRDIELMNKEITRARSDAELAKKESEKAGLDAIEWKRRTLTAVNHFDVLEEHINQRKGPPPPPRPELY